ncbi:MAG: hypothetical protein IJQ02_11940 [Oscillospiraceae bacterium]|nr:hypothetical protein [Oscillospiraceae bacterium]
MALKKYRFFVGACGPTMMYSNIIRAEDELSAVKIYLSEREKELSDENIANGLRNIREIVPKDKPDKLLDGMGKEIQVGDDVVFIRNASGSPPILLTGKVERLSDKSIVVKDPKDQNYRIVLPKWETDMLPRVIVMSARPEREKTDPVDGSGYPLQMGDPVAYMKDAYSGSSEGFITGTVTKITAKNVAVGEKRKNFDKVVIINW